MITKPVPLDAAGAQVLSQLFTVANAFRFKCLVAFKAQECVTNAALRQFTQVRNDLRLTERVKHSVVGDKQDALLFTTAVKSSFTHRPRPPPELCGCRAARPRRATETNR